MSTTSLITTAVIILIGLAFLVDRVKRASATGRNTTAKPSQTKHTLDNQPITAAESGPTHTGRFRVQEMLQKTNPKSKEVQTVSEDAEHPEDHEALPDPFSSDE